MVLHGTKTLAVLVLCLPSVTDQAMSCFKFRMTTRIKSLHITLPETCIAISKHGDCPISYHSVIEWTVTATADSSWLCNSGQIKHRSLHALRERNNTCFGVRNGIWMGSEPGILLDQAAAQVKDSCRAMHAAMTTNTFAVIESKTESKRHGHWRMHVSLIIMIISW